MSSGSSSSFFFLLALSPIILVSSLFPKAAAVRPVLDGRSHFLAPTNNPVYIPGIGDSTASRSYIPGGDGLMLPRGSLGNDGLMLPRPRGSLGNKPIVRSRGGNAVSSSSYISGGDGLMLPRPRESLGNDGFMLPRPRGSLGNNPIARSPGGNSLSTTGRSFVGSPGGKAVSSRSYVPVGHFMLHKRSLGYIPIVRSPDMLAASCLPSPSAYVVESEPPSKPTPPTCYPRC